MSGCAPTTPDNDHISEIIPVTVTFVSVNAVAARRVAEPLLVDRQPSRPRQPDMFTNDSAWSSRPRGYVRLASPRPPAGNDEAQPEEAQPSDTNAETSSAAKASDEQSEEDLEAVAGSPRNGT